MAFDTTTEQVLAGQDLSGMTALVTGTSSGIGMETARALAAAGAHVVATARSEEKATEVAGELDRRLGGAGSVETAVLELASLTAVRDFADRFGAGHQRLDVLVNNAGIMAAPLERTAEGFELQFGTNHLGPFVLTNRLLALMVRPGSRAARVVNVSSAGHQASGIRWDDPNFEHSAYDRWEAYGQSKTANILFAKELDRRVADAGVRAFSLHPGMIATSLGRHLSRQDYADLAERAARSPSGGLPERKSLAQGAATSVWAATSPELDGKGGLYLADCEVATPASWADDPEEARRLWALSEDLVGEHFDP